MVQKAACNRYSMYEIHEFREVVFRLSFPVTNSGRIWNFGTQAGNVSIF